MTTTLYEHSIAAIATDDAGRPCDIEIGAEVRDVGGCYEPSVVLVRARAETAEDVWSDIGVAAALEWLARRRGTTVAAVAHEIEAQVSDAYARHEEDAREREERDSYGY